MRGVREYFLGGYWTWRKTVLGQQRGSGIRFTNSVVSGEGMQPQISNIILLCRQLNVYSICFLECDMHETKINPSFLIDILVRVSAAGLG